MKRSDDVFFFTLIDFLLQVFFFGLLLFVAAQAVQVVEAAKAADDAAKQEKLVQATGVSNITELTDWLTRMAPLKELQGMADFISRNGGLKSVESTLAAVTAAGGPEKLGKMQEQMTAMKERIATLEGGWGKVSCVPNVMVNGRLQPKSVASVTVTDDRITLASPAPEFEALLQRHGLDIERVRSLDVATFRSTFAPVVAKQPECRYFLGVTTRTKYLEPMQAVWSAFRTQ